MNFKVFYRALYNKTLSPFYHVSRTNQIRKRVVGIDFVKETDSIIHDRIPQNLYLLRNRQWESFGDNPNDWETIEQKLSSIVEKNYERAFIDISSRFDKKSPLKKKMIISQYIAGISPRWFEQKDIVKFDSKATKWGKLTWGIKEILDPNAIIDVFSNITKTVIEERDNAYHYQNFVGATIHLDEKSPHIHIFFTNVDDTGDLSEISNKNEPKYNYIRDRIVDNINESELIKYDHEKISFNDRDQNNHTWWKENFAEHMEVWLRRDWEQKIAVEKNKEKIKELEANEGRIKKELSDLYVDFTSGDKAINQLENRFIEKNLDDFEDELDMINEKNKIQEAIKVKNERALITDENNFSSQTESIENSKTNEKKIEKDEHEK